VEKVAQWMSTTPARLAGLDHRKAKLAAGFDADIIVWDPDELGAPASRAGSAISPYVGLALNGRVESTYVAGRLVKPA
ncbi:MAG: amidohydrolase family protein, partial [Thermoanaerobaculia bacterium]